MPNNCKVLTCHWYNNNVKNIVLVYGDLRKTEGAINLNLSDERVGMHAPIISKLLHRIILETVLDMIITKYIYERDKINF